MPLKTKFRSILPCLLLLAAAPLMAQTPTPSPSTTPDPAAVYNDGKQPVAARIAAAQTLAAASNDPDVQEFWTDRADTVNIGHLNKQIYLANVDLVETVLKNHGQMITGSTPGGQEQTYLFAAALGAKVAYGLADTEARLSFIYPMYQVKDSLDPFIATRVALIYAQQLEYKANDSLGKSDFANAIACASDPAVLTQPSTCYAGIVTVARAKARSRAADALSWAKLGYLCSNFNQTQAGVDMVAAAYRATDMNLARANTFIAAQNDPAQPNALASVAVPDQFKAGGLPEPIYAAVNLYLQGSNQGALQSAMASYIAASSNVDLTSSAALIAQNLRNIDGNLGRANAFIAAQKAGATYPITELH